MLLEGILDEGKIICEELELVVERFPPSTSQAVLHNNPNKIKNGIIKACEKRPVPISTIEKLVEDIQKRIYNSLAQEITSKEIGEMVMSALKEIDEVAYVRFASVYRSFTDISSFLAELENMVKHKGNND